MSTCKVDLTCPHCGIELRSFRVPDGTSWQQNHHWACFNNDCPYFKDGWEWMREQYNVRASYRYRVTGPEDKKGTPIAVPTEQALLELIVEHDDEQP